MAAMPAQGGAQQLWHPDRSKTGVFPDLFRNIKKPFKLSEPHDKKKNNPTLIILSGTTVCLHAVYEKKAWLIQCLGRQTLDLSRHAWMQCKWRAAVFLNISSYIPAICSMSAQQPSPIILLGSRGEREKYTPTFFQARKHSRIHTFSLRPWTDSSVEWSRVTRFSAVTSKHRLKISCFILNEDQALDFLKPGV